jgi:hypothetical protein
MVIWNILRPFVIFMALGNFVVIWHIFPVLVLCLKKNLATLKVSAAHVNENFPDGCARFCVHLP